MYKVQVQAIYCSQTGGSQSDPDDVIIVTQSDGGLPITFPDTSSFVLEKGQSIDLTHGGTVTPPTYFFEHGATIMLYDRDGPINYIDVADFLVSTLVTPDQAGGPVTLSLSGEANKARYSVTIQVTQLDLTAMLEEDVKTLIHQHGSRGLNGFLAPNSHPAQLGSFDYAIGIVKVQCTNTVAPSSNDNVTLQSFVDGANEVTCVYPPRNSWAMDDNSDNILSRPGGILKFNDQVKIELWAGNNEMGNCGYANFQGDDFDAIGATSTKTISGSAPNKPTGKVSYTITMQLLNRPS